MSDMVERVAQAICGDNNPANILSIHRSRARIAIEVMRAPTREMCEAGQRVNNLSEELGRFEFLSCDEMATAWQAMIDEALRNMPAAKTFNTDPQT